MAKGMPSPDSIADSYDQRRRALEELRGIQRQLVVGGALSSIDLQAGLSAAAKFREANQRILDWLHSPSEASKG